MKPTDILGACGGKHKAMEECQALDLPVTDGLPITAARRCACG